MVCFWWKILPNVYLRQKRNPCLWLIWKWLIKSVIACVTNSQQLHLFVAFYCAKKEVWEIITDTMIHSHFQYKTCLCTCTHAVSIVMRLRFLKYFPTVECYELMTSPHSLTPSCALGFCLLMSLFLSLEEIWKIPYILPLHFSPRSRDIIRI